MNILEVYIYHNLSQFTVEYLGGTFDRKSVLRGTQSLCATLPDLHTGLCTGRGLLLLACWEGRELT